MHCLGNPTMHRPVSVGDEQTGTGEGRIEAKLNSKSLHHLRFNFTERRFIFIAYENNIQKKPTKLPNKSPTNRQTYKETNQLTNPGHII
jgi:hypothetical protein